MADLSDVANTLVGIISGIIYPNGTSQPPASKVSTRVFYGWPIPDTLTTDVVTGKADVSIYPLPTERNTTRYPLRWQPVLTQTATLTMTIAGQTVTVGGSVPPASNPHVVMMMVNYLPYPYAVQPSDTLSTIAAALASLISVNVPGTSSSGSVVTLPATAILTAARVGVTSTSLLEIRRQERLFQITIWAANFQDRDALAQLIDPVLALTFRITLPDLSSARLIYRNSPQTDKLQKEMVYRRDLIYSVEYATTKSEIDWQVTQTELNVSVAVAGVLPYAPAVTIYE